MDRFYILHLGNEPHKEVSAIARTVIDTVTRPITEVRITGIQPFLSDYVDADAVETLIDAGVSTDGDTLQGTAAATPEVCDAAFSLFSNSLLNIEFVDESGKLVFERKDTDADFVYLSPSEYELVADNLSTNLLAQIYPSDTEIPFSRLPNGTDPAAKTQLKEYKFVTSATDEDLENGVWNLIGSLNRDIGQLQFSGLVAVLQRVDQDALAVLQSDDVDTNDILIAKTLPATDDHLDALRSLWNNGIHYVYCQDTNSEPLLLRESPKQDYLYLSEAEYDAIENRIPGVLERSHRW